MVRTCIRQGDLFHSTGLHRKSCVSHSVSAESQLWLPHETQILPIRTSKASDWLIYDWLEVKYSVTNSTWLQRLLRKKSNHHHTNGCNVYSERRAIITTLMQNTMIRGHSNFYRRWPTKYSVWPLTIIIMIIMNKCDTVNEVPAGSPSRGGELLFMSKDRNQPSLPTSFYSVLVSISVFIALSTVFHSINSPDNSPFSHCGLPVSSPPYWPFRLCISLWKSPSVLIYSLVVDWTQNSN